MIISKFSHIEYTDIESGLLLKYPVVRASFYAAVPSFMQTSPKSCSGLCICIALKHKDKDTSDNVMNRILGDCREHRDIKLCGNDVKIPLKCISGNGFNEKSKTSCLFAYACPELFDSRDPPYPPLEAESSFRWTDTY